MVRWLERTATTSATSPVSTPTVAASLLLNHKMFMSSGHDEYWSGPAARQRRGRPRRRREPRVLQRQRDLLEDALGDQHRRHGTPYRTLVSYKETHADAKIDPSPAVDRHLAGPALQPARRRRPARERADRHASSRSTARGRRDQVPAADGKLRFWRNTAIAQLSAGQTATLPPGTLGYEWDADLDNGFRPAGLIDMSQTTVDIPTAAVHLRTTATRTAAGTPTHNIDAVPGAERRPGVRRGHGPVVMGPRRRTTTDVDGRRAADARMQQATVNLFADMGVQPATLLAGLTAGDAVHRHHRADGDHHLARRRRDRRRSASPITDHRHRDRHRRRRRRRRRGLDRRRRDLAPGHRAASRGRYTLDTAPAAGR